MNQPGGTPTESPPHRSSVTINNGHDELSELRSLLIGPEQSQLAKLRARLDNPQRFAEEISTLLPDAISLRTAKDQQLTKALTPTVEAALSASVKKDPRPLVDAITPVIGPAIRKAIAQAFSELTQSINQAMERSFSKEGLLWRVEAWQTGKPFSEVVLSHTLLYRVEQVFLIHRKTGLLLQHVVGSTKTVQDADMVSSMLTAIRDFVQDSFGTQSEEFLDNFQVGELTVLVEQGPQALLAALIRGTAPKDLRVVFQETIEQIHLAHAQALDEFDGDATPLEQTRPYLEDCLRSQTSFPPGRQKEKKISPLLSVVGVVAALLLVWMTLSVRNRWRWEAYLDRLKAEPGLVVVSTGKEDGKYIIRGLRDPLAADPIAVLRETPISPEQVVAQWEPYQSLTPAFVLVRAKSLLVPPPGVILQFANGVLSASGAAPTQWIVDARKLARAIPGVTELNERELLDADAHARALKLKELQTAKAAVEQAVVYFPVSSHALLAKQDQMLTQLATSFQTLFAAAQFVGHEVWVDVVGHTDGTGIEKKNVMLRQQRAGRVISELGERGLLAAQVTLLQPRAGGLLHAESTEQDLAANRCVTFEVRMADRQNKP